MKGISSFLFLFLFTLGLVACGQQTQDSSDIPKTGLDNFKYYEYKSFFYQHTLPDSAIYYTERALKLSRALKYYHGEASMLNQFARINEQYGNYKLAERYEQEALTLFTGLHDTLACADVVTSLGMLKARQGDLHGGIRLIAGVLPVYKKHRFTDGAIRAYTCMGDLYELHGKLDKALEYYTKAEQLNNDMSFSSEYLSLLRSIGNVYTKQGNAEKALYYFDKGVSRSAAAGNKKEHITFLRRAGKVSDTFGNEEKALDYHNKGLQVAREAGEQEEEVRLLMSIAMIVKDKDAGQGIMHLTNALSISRDIGNQPLSSEIYSSLAVLYRQQSRYQDALVSLEQHHRLNDSLLSATKGQKIMALQTGYELAASKAHIDHLEIINHKTTFERNAFLLAATAILIILLILAVYFYKKSRLNKQLQASNRIKDKLFSIIGHDLRTPVGGIAQLLEIMDEGGVSADRQKPMIKEMRKQSNAALDILTALLSWGESQLKGIHTEPFDFNPASTVIKNTEALDKQAKDKSITIINNMLPDRMINGDINHFDFVIRNLLSNAIKFSNPSGNIELASSDKTEPGYITFSVKDHGKGITREQQQLFITGSLDISYGTKGEKGTGIGLMLSKEFIKANHGKIWIESEAGKGSTFYFTFVAAGNAA